MKDRAIAKFIRSTPWAILPSALDVIVQIVEEHMEGKNVEVDAASKAKTVGFVGASNVAIIPVHGTLAKRLYGLDAISGGRTMGDIKENIEQALNDPAISSIVLDVDSPGGTVDGTKELADFIRESKAKKPIVAYANGLSASAAYWISSAATKIVAFDTTQVGSIGVIVSHTDRSKQLEEAGLKITHIYHGKYKAMGNQTEALSPEAIEYIQEKVDYYHTMFVDAIAENRGLKPSDVEAMQAKIFIGTQALDVGLVDKIGNLKVAIEVAQEEGGIMAQQGEMTLSDFMSLAKARTDLPDAVKMAIEQAGTPVVSLPPELQAQIDALNDKVKQLEVEKAQANAALEAEKVAQTIKAKQADLEAKLTSLKLNGNEGLLSALMGMDETGASAVLETFTSFSSKLKEVSKELFTETTNAGVEGKSEDEPEDFEAACRLVAKRENIKAEEAGKLAKKEYPQLFAKYLDGGE